MDSNLTKSILEQMQQQRQPQQMSPLQQSIGHSQLPQSAQQLEVPSNVPRMPLKQELTPLGGYSEQYEAPDGVSQISSGKKDKYGGKSYGNHQLSSKQGAMEEYLVWSDKYGSKFDYLDPGDADFDKKYLEIAKNDGKNFAKDQSDYFKHHYFDPVREYADKIGIKNHRAIDEAIYSASIQHGKSGARSILRRSKEIYNGKDTSKIVDAFFDARRERIKKKSNKENKQDLLNRSFIEQRSTLDILKEEGRRDSIEAMERKSGYKGNYNAV